MAEFELGLLRATRPLCGVRAESETRLYVVGSPNRVSFAPKRAESKRRHTDRYSRPLRLFSKSFINSGSARQATIWFREVQIPLPHVKGGTAGKEVFWALPSSGRILQILRNPCYGGAFAYGKTAPRTVIADGRIRQQSRYRKPQNEWKILITDHHPGYISWEEYLENQRRLEANVAWADGESSGAAKSGTAMLSGLLRCGRCGRKLQVVYSGNGGRVPQNGCRETEGDRGSSPCLTIGSLRVDRAVIHSVLAVIQPAGIEAAVKVTECAQAEDDEKRQGTRSGIGASKIRRRTGPAGSSMLSSQRIVS